MVEIFHRQLSAVDTATLAAGNSIVIAGMIAEPAVRNFMLKNLYSIHHIKIPVVEDKFFLALTDADASDTERNQGFDTTSQNPEDGTVYPRDQQRVRRTWGIQGIDYDGIAAGDTIQVAIQWKLPPKGIPVLKGRGIDITLVNLDNANPFSNGPSISTYAKAMGGWF